VRGPKFPVLVRLSNHSRDRHGSIFDGAEWDESRHGVSCSGGLRIEEVWQVLFGYGMSFTSLVVSTAAFSRTRRGMD